MRCRSRDRSARQVATMSAQSELLSEKYSATPWLTKVEQGDVDDGLEERPRPTRGFFAVWCSLSVLAWILFSKIRVTDSAVDFSKAALCPQQDPISPQSNITSVLDAEYAQDGFLDRAVHWLAGAVKIPFVSRCQYSAICVLIYQRQHRELRCHGTCR